VLDAMLVDFSMLQFVSCIAALSERIHEKVLAELTDL
jgi:hypothetical protein